MLRLWLMASAAVSWLLFVLGDNDTKLEVLGGLAYFLVLIPATLLAWRYRNLAALLLLLSAALFILGVMDDEIYLS